jgi:hypothetical protein
LHNSGQSVILLLLKCRLLRFLCGLFLSSVTLSYLLRLRWSSWRLKRGNQN